MVDWQIGYIIYMSEGLFYVIAMQISIEQIYSRHGVRFNTLSIGELFSMYAFRMKFRFAGAHYHVDWDHIYLIPAGTQISRTVFIVQ